jgi:DNA-binding transcriptional regulator YdaS (Cro superfamily)
MRTLTDIAFATLLARADVAQAAFARLVGITPRQVNNWCRGRAAVRSPEALTIDRKDACLALTAPQAPRP